MNETLVGAIAAAESVLDGSSGGGAAFFADLTTRLGDIDSSDVQKLSYLAVLLDRIGLRAESLQVLRYGCSQLAGRSSPAKAELHNVEGVLAAWHGEYHRARVALAEASALAGNAAGLRSKIMANRVIVDLWTGRTDDAQTGIATIRNDQRQPSLSVDLALATAETEAARLTDDLEAFRKAVKALRDAVKHRIVELGSDHPLAVFITADLAAMELDLARAEGSYVRLQRVTEVLERLCCRLAAEQGAEHPRTLAALANLASAQLDLAIWEGAQQRMVYAAESLSKTAERITSVLGTDHPRSLAVSASLAAAQVKLAQADRSADKVHDPVIAPSAAGNPGSAGTAGRPVRPSDGDVTMQEIGSGQGFWHLLTPDNRRAFSALGSTKKYQPGATVCVQGDPATHVFVLVDGWVKVLSVTDEGHETVLALRGDGDTVGEASGETTGHRNATIKAITVVDALIVSYDTFSAFLDGDRAADRAYRRMLTRRWTETDTLLRLRAVTDGTQRFARLLVELAGRFGAEVDGAIEIALPLSQEELASLAGTKRSTVTRALGKWRQRGLIRTSQHQRHIVIADVAGLEQFAGPAI